MVYVDSLPLAPGDSINTELTEGWDGEIPLPDWAEFDEEDFIDLDADLRSMFRRIAVPEPVGVARDQQTLMSDRRYEVPVTVIACEFSADRLRGWIADGEDFVSELARITDVEIVDLPTGHGLNSTRPGELASAILATIGSCVENLSQLHRGHAVACRLVEIPCHLIGPKYISSRPIESAPCRAAVSSAAPSSARPYPRPRCPGSISMS